MKRVFEIMLFPVATILILVSGTGGKNITDHTDLVYQSVKLDDTTELIRLIHVDTFKLAIIPPSSGVQFYKDGIVFLTLSKYDSKMSPNHISFGSTVASYATIEGSLPGSHTLFSQSSSFSYPCEAMTFSVDYNTLYFTIIPQREKKEKIFMAKSVTNTKNQKEWIPEANSLDFCTGNSNYSHPALSFDDKMLIFASDKEGFSGGMDLFISRKSDGKWSSPENLGIVVNTAGNEFYPFLDSGNNLFFSSDGLPGYGGYDIFTCKYNGMTWDKPVNLSDHINSADDDIAFTINKTDGKTAFYTRRQMSRKNGMQLFKATISKESADNTLLTISYVFNGNPVRETSFVPAKTVSELKPVEAELPKKEAVKTSNPIVSLPDAKAVILKPTIPPPVEQKNVIIYRVQILPSTTQKNSKKMVINGTSYKIYEYLYRGVDRYTIGEFSTVAAAAVLQNACRRSGYPQSFVVAFENNIRSLDPKLFK